MLADYNRILRYEQNNDGETVVKVEYRLNEKPVIRTFKYDSKISLNDAYKRIPKAVYPLKRILELSVMTIN